MALDKPTQKQTHCIDLQQDTEEDNKANTTKHITQIMATNNKQTNQQNTTKQTKQTQNKPTTKTQNKPTKQTPNKQKTNKTKRTMST